ncbi:T9SS type A sorting domain-containing protein [Flavobacterium paronense]|uniref:T9SS type A sorting domain-containing protein n=1 Tax=Flavobacterium paronense TaxID=1392775 RepID=A0ABV5GB25_9FLAO|nr:T9SS type A sorting domain-containing protein [Flavobacterium paronense]MDN3676821.1 T9SS type A sorting domain-containing protein [Flavobacterium paronense]
MKKELLLLIALLFISETNYSQVISMIGSTSPSGSWGVDTNMTTTDNITYTLNNATITTATDPATTGLKFRQGNDWLINWGSANFPSGTATQGGANIMTVAGTYDVTFNRINGTYTFIPSGFPSIGIWGPAVNSQLGYGAPDVDMVTTDGIIYTLSGFYFSSGNCYFRQNNDTVNVWGSTTFPTGTGMLNGPSLFVPGGEWFVTFNRNTGEYSFTYPSIGILGTALNGFLADDIDLTTTDGFGYSISNLSLTDGEVKFRKDNDWTTNWGSLGFPTGTGIQSGQNIPVTAGIYDITFDKSTGNYEFTNTLSNNENSISKLKIYPNPTDSIWNITHTTTIDSVQVFDVMGKAIQSFSPNASQFELDGSALSQGVYFVNIKSGTDFVVQKIIKN